MINPEFLLTSLVVVLIPGTGAVYTITTGLTLRWRASLAAAVGCTLGIVPHILASILGLSALLNMSAQVFSALKLVGSVYLLYLASGVSVYLLNSAKVVKRIEQAFAVILAGFAVKLVLSEK